MLKRWIALLTVIGFSLTGFQADAATKKTGKMGTSATKTSKMKGKSAGFYKSAYGSKQKKK